jgi:hypothetical protein
MPHTHKDTIVSLRSQFLVVLPPMCATFPWSIHHLMDPLGWFSTLRIVNSAAVNRGMQLCLLYVDLHSLRYMPRSGIAGSYYSSSFSLWRKLHSDFHSSLAKSFDHPYALMSTEIADNSELTQPTSKALVITVLGEQKQTSSLYFSSPVAPGESKHSS